MIVPLLCGMMLILTLMRVAVPIGQPVTGEVLGVVPLRFGERLRLQRVNIYLIGVMLLLGTLGGWLHTPLSLIVVLAAYVIISVPVQYTVTTEGIARNRVVFRLWSEFEGVEDGRGHVLLHGAPGARDFPLLLAPDQHAEMLRLLAVTPLGASTTAEHVSPTTPPARTRGRGKRRRAATA